MAALIRAATMAAPAIETFIKHISLFQQTQAGLSYSRRYPDLGTGGKVTLMNRDNAPPVLLLKQH